MNKGIIIKQESNNYTVLDGGTTYLCHARGKFRHNSITPLVGDFCNFDGEQGYILDILPRKNELSRPTIANVDVAIILTSAKEPNISLSLLDKQLACILNEGIKPIICISKFDLLSREEKKYIKRVIKDYKSIGFDVIINTEKRKLKRLIKGKTVVLTGQTGAGKSSLLNRLDKTLNLETKEISKALGRGVHTTRHTEIYFIAGAYIADTPGFSALDLNIDKDKLKTLYPEFDGITCKFDNCNHIREKGCMVKDAVDNKRILKSRYDNYVRFWGELK